MDSAGRRLKELRERAGLTMKEVADFLGWRLTRYQHYEDRYTKPYMPADMILRLADLLEQHGIERTLVTQLGGMESSEILENSSLRGENIQKSENMLNSDDLRVVLSSAFSDGTRLELRCNRPLDNLTVKRLKALLTVYEVDG